jgi:hypothetical protein
VRKACDKYSSQVEGYLTKYLIRLLKVIKSSKVKKVWVSVPEKPMETRNLKCNLDGNLEHLNEALDFSL